MNKKKVTGIVVSLATALSLAQTAQARDLTIEITNLTQGIYFTPRLAVAHTADIDLFQAGEPASEELAWVAEAGSTEQFEAYLDDPARADNNTFRVFGGLLAPATIAPYETFSVEDGEQFLSLVAMMLPTNDGFIGLDSWRIPEEPGTYIVNLNAYDAGSEANDEIAGNRTDVVEAGTGNPIGGYGVPGFPVPPPLTNIGQGGTGVAISIESGELEDATDGNVHIHRNVLGDTDANGGNSDIDATVHRWLNPVARLKIGVGN